MEPNNLLLCQLSTKLDDQWRNLYEGAFPAGEREPTDKLARLIEEGKILYHRTTNEEGVLLCFTMVTLAPSFSFLAYMATNPQTRSGGIGTKHLQRLLEYLQQTYPHHLGLFLEIEATAPKNEVLTPEEQTNRLRRRKFYEERIGARVLCHDVPYLTPRYGNEHQKEWEGELLAIEFAEPLCQQDVVRVICEIYERFYHLPPNHPLATRVIDAFRNCKHTCDTSSGDGRAASGPATTGSAAVTTPAVPVVPAEKPAAKPSEKPEDSQVATDSATKPGSAAGGFFLWRWLRGCYAYVRALLRKFVTG